MSWPWEAAIVVLWVVVLVLCVMVLGMLRRIAPVLARAEKIIELQQTLSPGIGGLEPGSEVTPFEVVADGDKVLRLGEELAYRR
ncbi:hypothetical protein [Rubrobacter calidifluminis]|uniref:hypothetical protein n=1 Tax=Rubrobacter calidifluminis TaxID=1392640 RepID=UPI0023626E37|nr:hypothetical protein [Rubrobacter calidifluminis]